MGRRYRRRTALVPIVCSDVFNFAEKAGGDVIYKAANSDSLRNPRVRTEFLELLTDIFIDVFERVEIGGSKLRLYLCDPGFGRVTLVRPYSSARSRCD